MCKQSQTFSVRKNKAIKSLSGAVLAAAAIVAVGGSASADEVTATNTASSNAPTTAVTTTTDTTSNATTAPATTNANTPATPTTTQETPKEIPAKVESVTQRSGHSREHAVCLRALARRYADQLPDRVQACCASQGTRRGRFQRCARFRSDQEGTAAARA